VGPPGLDQRPNGQPVVRVHDVEGSFENALRFGEVPYRAVAHTVVVHEEIRARFAGAAAVADSLNALMAGLPGAEASEQMDLVAAATQVASQFGHMLHEPADGHAVLGLTGQQGDSHPNIHRASSRWRR